tara:strand:+ start:998 stop:1312 length:315 start_codon:yes stop_codon:yes gene_type:complete
MSMVRSMLTATECFQLKGTATIGIRWSTLARLSSATVSITTATDLLMGLTTILGIGTQMGWAFVKTVMIAIRPERPVLRNSATESITIVMVCWEKMRSMAMAMA